MDELTLLIQSRHPLVVVECDDEARLFAHLTEACATLGLPLFSWSVTEGVKRLGANSPVYETCDPAKALGHIEAAAMPSVYAFCDLAPYLTDARLVRKLEMSPRPRMGNARQSCSRAPRSSCPPSCARSPRTGAWSCRRARS
jgi:hypothetical protein